MKERIVLAYSGGLDTSVAIPWLAERYGAEVIAVTLDLGQGRELATMFRGPSGKALSADYAALGRAMGADGWLVEKPADLAGRLEAAIAANRPTVLDVRVDPDVWPLATGSWDLPPLPAPLPNFGWEQD